MDTILTPVWDNTGIKPTRDADGGNTLISSFELPAGGTRRRGVRAPIGPDQGVVGVRAIHIRRQAHLLQIVETFCALGLFLGARQGRQQQGGEDRDNSDDHQQLNQGKSQNAEFILSSGLQFHGAFLLSFHSHFY